MEKTGKLLVLLNDLVKRLTTYNGTESTPAESYSFFVERSSSGEECTYAKKAARLFEMRDYNDVRELIFEVYKCIMEIDG